MRHCLCLFTIALITLHCPLYLQNMSSKSSSSADPSKAGGPAKMLTLEYKIERPAAAATAAMVTTPFAATSTTTNAVDSATTTTTTSMEAHKHVTMTLFVDMGVGIGGDKWPAADQFCSVITDYRWESFFEEIFSNKRIIELGSGTGQVGMLVDMLYSPVEVVITDLSSHVPHIEHNISLNPMAKRCRAIELDWFQPRTDIGAFDVILVFEW